MYITVLIIVCFNYKHVHLLSHFVHVLPYFVNDVYKTKIVNYRQVCSCEPLATRLQHPMHSCSYVDYDTCSVTRYL